MGLFLRFLRNFYRQNMLQSLKNVLKLRPYGGKTFESLHAFSLPKISDAM